MTQTLSRAIPALLLSLLVATLAACSSEPDPMTNESNTSTPRPSASAWTQKRAQERADATLEQIETLLSSNEVRTKNVASGSELSCGSDLTQWSGGVTLEYARTIDVAPLFDSVRKAFPATDGWSLKDSTTRKGAPRLSIRGDGGENYILSQWSDMQVDVVSFSPCYPTSAE
jgi:hypothetical protein